MHIKAKACTMFFLKHGGGAEIVHCNLPIYAPVTPVFRTYKIITRVCSFFINLWLGPQNKLPNGSSSDS